MTDLGSFTVVDPRARDHLKRLQTPHSQKGTPRNAIPQRNAKIGFTGKAVRSHAAWR